MIQVDLEVVSMLATKVAAEALDAVSDADIYVAFDVPMQTTFTHLRSLIDNAEIAQSMYFYDPDAFVHLGALGCTAEVSAAGEQRFADVKALLSDVSNRIYVSSISSPEPIAVRWFGGFAFSPKRPIEGPDTWSNWPVSSMFLPTLTLTMPACGPLRATAILHLERFNAAGVEASIQALLRLLRSAMQSKVHDSPPLPRLQNLQKGHNALREEEDWCARIVDATDTMAVSRLRKVVLARTASASVEVPLTLALKRLLNQYPENFTFAFRRGNQVFIGSTPERLVRVDEGCVRVDCLAGTTARGRTTEEDERLATALLQSSKNRREHQAVVDAIVENVASLVQDIDIASTPRVKVLANVQHLYTPLVATIGDGTDVLDLAQQLHPTPAVAGVPQSLALDYIERSEPVDRGWYAGPIGFVDTAGNGVFAVALRSAFVVGAAATLYAGNGIMSDSDPLSEWQETELKLQPMREALLLDKEV